MSTGEPNEVAAALHAVREAVDRQEREFFEPAGWGSIWQSAGLAAGFGFVVLLVASWGASDDAWETTEWDLLLAILVAQAAIWGLLLPRCRSYHGDIAELARAAWQPGRGQLARLSYQWQSVIAAVLVALAVGAIALGSAELLEPSRTQGRHYATALVLTALGGLTWYQIVVVMRASYVSTRLAVFRPGETSASDLGVVVGAYRLLAGRLRAALAVVGALLTMLVLAAGAAVDVANALRELAAEKTQGTNTEVVIEEIPATVVLLFGVALTGILVLVYLPTHLRMGSVRQYIIDGHYPLDHEEPKETLDGRAKLAAELGESSSGLDALQRSAVIIGPLLAGLASSFLGG